MLDTDKFVTSRRDILEAVAREQGDGTMSRHNIVSMEALEDALEDLQRKAPAQEEDLFVNLCATCVFTIPSCDAQLSSLKYGNGPGNDNIVACGTYRPKGVEKICGN